MNKNVIYNAKKIHRVVVNAINIIFVRKSETYNETALLKAKFEKNLYFHPLSQPKIRNNLQSNLKC